MSPRSSSASPRSRRSSARCPGAAGAGNLAQHLLYCFILTCLTDCFASEINYNYGLNLSDDCIKAFTSILACLRLLLARGRHHHGPPTFRSRRQHPRRDPCRLHLHRSLLRRRGVWRKSLLILRRRRRGLYPLRVECSQSYFDT